MAATQWDRYVRLQCIHIFSSALSQTFATPLTFMNGFKVKNEKVRVLHTFSFTAHHKSCRTIHDQVD